MKELHRFSVGVELCTDKQTKRKNERKQKIKQYSTAKSNNNGYVCVYTNKQLANAIANVPPQKQHDDYIQIYIHLATIHTHTQVIKKGRCSSIFHSGYICHTLLK